MRELAGTQQKVLTRKVASRGTVDEAKRLFQLSLDNEPKNVLSIAEASLPHFRGLAAAYVARAIARSARALGEFKKALSHAALAYAIDPNPHVELELLWLELLAGDMESREVVDIANGHLRYGRAGIHAYAHWILAATSKITGDYETASIHAQKMLENLAPDQHIYGLPHATDIFLAAGQRHRATIWLKSAQFLERNNITKALAHLARGIVARQPEEARPLLLKARRILIGRLAEEAFRATAYLGGILDYPELTDRGRSLLQRASQPLRLITFGNPRVIGAPKIRPRGLELLVLLTLNPNGWSTESLAEALYGADNKAALKNEICRLRKTLPVPITHPPYRLAGQIESDLRSLDACLANGDVDGALSLFTGPFMPFSKVRVIEEKRRETEEAVKALIIEKGSLEQLRTLLERIPDDPEVIETILGRLPEKSPLRTTLKRRLKDLLDA